MISSLASTTSSRARPCAACRLQRQLPHYRVHVSSRRRRGRLRSRYNRIFHESARAEPRATSEPQVRSPTSPLSSLSRATSPLRGATLRGRTRFEDARTRFEDARDSNLHQVSDNTSSPSPTIGLRATTEPRATAVLTSVRSRAKSPTLVLATPSHNHVANGPRRTPTFGTCDTAPFSPTKRRAALWSRQRSSDLRRENHK